MVDIPRTSSPTLRGFIGQIALVADATAKSARSIMKLVGGTTQNDIDVQTVINAIRDELDFTPRVFNALAYGGYTSAAIQAAANAAAAAGGGIVYAPAGTYVITSTVLIASNVTLRGDGRGATILQSSSLYPMICSKEVTTGTGATKRSFNGGLEDLTITAQDHRGVSGGYLVDGDGWYNKTIRRVGFLDGAGGVHIRGDIGGTYGAYYGTLHDCTFDGLSVGGRFSYGGNEWGLFKGRFNDCGTGLLLAGCTGVKVIAPAFESSTTAVQLGQSTDDNDGTAQGCVITDARFEGLTSGFKFLREIGTQIRGSFIGGTVTTAYDETSRAVSGTGHTPSYTIVDDVNVVVSGGASLRTMLHKRVQLAFGTVNAGSYVDKQVLLDGMVATDHVTVSVEGNGGSAINPGLHFDVVDKDAGVCYVRAQNTTGSGIVFGTHYVTVVAWRFN